MSKVFNWALARWVSYGSFNGNSFGVLDCIGYTLSFPVLVWGNQSEPDYKTGECAILSIASWLFQRIFSAISTFIPVMSSKVRFTFSALPTTSTCRGVNHRISIEDNGSCFCFSTPPHHHTPLVAQEPIIQCHFKMHSFTCCPKVCIWVLAPFRELIKLNLSQHKKNDKKSHLLFVDSVYISCFALLEKTYLHPQAPDLTTGITIKAPETSFELGLVLAKPP